MTHLRMSFPDLFRWALKGREGAFIKGKLQEVKPYICKRRKRKRERRRVRKRQEKDARLPSLCGAAQFRGTLRS